MSEVSALVALLANSFIIVVLYCVPMLKRIDELEKRISEMQRQLENIEKALYVIPEKEEEE